MLNLFIPMMPFTPGLAMTAKVHMQSYSGGGGPGQILENCTELMQFCKGFRKTVFGCHENRRMFVKPQSSVKLTSY